MRCYLAAYLLLVALAPLSTAVAQDFYYRNYFALEGRAGDTNELLQGRLFLPLHNTEQELLFADMRLQHTDIQTSEANIGLAYRRMVNSSWIAGVYGFYDLNQTTNDNTFHQAAFGAELLSDQFDLRVNGYIPDRDAQLTGTGSAFFQGGTIVVRPFEERAYYGADVEAGALLWRCCDCMNTEIRGYAGAFHFDNDTPGFDNITGPRVRAEMRMYDLPVLGIDSRVTLGGQYQYDDVRGSQGTALMAVRIPFGAGGCRGYRMNALQRRMTEVIVRDVDIITNQGLGAAEAAVFADTGQAVGQVNVVDANTANVPAAVAGAGANGTVIVDGSQGVVNVNAPIMTQSGQTLRGAGFQVRGGNSGTVATFGSRPTINGTNAGMNVIEATADATITGLDITGGMNGVHVTGMSGAINIAILDNNFNGVGGDSVFVNTSGTSSLIANIRNNAIQGGVDGLDITSGGTGANLLLIGGNSINNVTGTGILIDSAQTTTINSLGGNNTITNSGTIFTFLNQGNLNGSQILINGVLRP